MKAASVFLMVGDLGALPAAAGHCMKSTRSRRLATEVIDHESTITSN